MSDNMIGVVAGDLLQAMSEAQDIYKNELDTQMKVEFMSNVHSTGKLARWVQDVSDSFVADAPSFAGSQVKGTVSLPNDTNNWDRAWVLTDGNENILDESGHPHTKPGQETWDADMTEKSVHTTVDRAMPDAYYHSDGYIDKQIMKNAMTRAKPRLDAHFNQISKKISSKLFKEMAKMAGGK